VRVQDVGQDEVFAESWKSNENHQSGTGFFAHKTIISEARIMEFVEGQNVIYT
jgi:hypothetical protein